jgi:hypothetical protein
MGADRLNSQLRLVNGGVATRYMAALRHLVNGGARALFLLWSLAEQAEERAEEARLKTLRQKLLSAPLLINSHPIASPFHKQYISPLSS